MQPVIAIALKAINKPSVADNGEQADKDDDRWVCGLCVHYDTEE